MKSIKRYHKFMLACLLPASLMLTGCNDDDENVVPTATATAATSATEGTVGTLTGEGTGDGTLAYAWTQTAGALAIIKNADMASATFIAPVLDTTNTTESLTFLLTVTDADAETATDDVAVTIDLDTAIAKYKVVTTNITKGQPLTPVATLLHDSTFSAWSVGAVASAGLEVLAESGSPRQFLSESVNDNTGVVAGGAVAGVTTPGSTGTTFVGATASTGHMLSIATMLANTNDAYAGAIKWSVGDLAVGDSATALAHVYDAGTENNTEAAGTIAGPADVSTATDKGFSVTRDDPSAFVSLHSGAVTKDDGLSTSVLNETHRWLGVAAKFEVTRIQ